MPTPKRNESKQDFLSRCTRWLIDKEGREPGQSYAMCNAYWDEGRVGKRNTLTLSAPVELQAGEGDDPASFMITAYTGRPVDTWFGRLVFDLNGMKTRETMPILREHMRDRIVGYGNKAWADKQNFYVSGKLSRSTPDASEIASLAGEGFPWQASVGIWPLTIKVLGEQDVETVNGQDIRGPAEIWQESLVGEVSFVALGADGDTAAIVLSDRGAEVPVEIISPQQQTKEEEAMDLNEFKETFPELFAGIDQAAFDRGRDDGYAAGVAEERERVTGILAVERADVDARISAVQSGISLDAAYKSFFEAAVAQKARDLEEMETSAPEPMGQEPLKEPEPEDTRPADVRLDDAAKKIVNEEQVSYPEACSLALRRDPALEIAWNESRVSH